MEFISKALEGLQRARASWKPNVRGDVKRRALPTARDLSKKGEMKDGQVLELCGLRQSLMELELEHTDKLAQRHVTYLPMAAAATAPFTDERVAALEAELRRMRAIASHPGGASRPQAVVNRGGGAGDTRFGRCDEPRHLARNCVHVSRRSASEPSRYLA